MDSAKKNYCYPEHQDSRQQNNIIVAQIFSQNTGTIKNITVIPLPTRIQNIFATENQYERAEGRQHIIVTQNTGTFERPYCYPELR